MNVTPAVSIVIPAYNESESIQSSIARIARNVSLPFEVIVVVDSAEDTTIPVKHAYYMKEKAEALHAPVETLIIKNAGHNWRQVDAPITPTQAEIVAKTVDFLIQQLKAHP